MLDDRLKTLLASQYIREAHRWIADRVNTIGQYHVFSAMRPEMVERLIDNPIWQQHWHRSKNLDLLKSELRSYMREWERVIKTIKEIKDGTKS